MSGLPPTSRHIISILVEDRYGELARIVGLFSGRGYNIDSLTVNQGLEPGMSRVVLTTRGDAQVIEQIIKQVNKLVRVHKVRHIVGDGHLERELCVATVRAASARAREELERVLKLTGARVLTYSSSSFTVEATGTSQDIEQFPVLGDIPILGALFRSRDFRQQQTELVILVTPYLVSHSPANTIAVPTDTSTMANDAEGIFLGRLEHMYGVGATGEFRGGFSGSVGFVLD